MRTKKYTTIFKQLIIFVVIPAIVGLVVLAVFNYYNTQKLLKKSLEYKNLVITEEIKNILELQDVALEILEENLDTKMLHYSQRIVNEFLAGSKDIENIDLEKIRDKIGMNSDLEDIYIINERGIVVNTTFKKDMHLNFFNFGEQHKNLLLGVLKGDNFVSERFAIESSTKRLKKYTYQPTIDGKHIVEIGIYSKKADEIIDFIKNRLNNLALESETVNSVDLFIGEDNHFSLNGGDTSEIKQKHAEILKDVFANKETKSVYTSENSKSLHYDYIYMDRKNTDLYKSSVIRIVTDRAHEISTLRWELIKTILIFIVVIGIVMIMLYLNVKKITKPIQKVEYNLNRIAEGYMKERAEIIGNNEISKLAEHYNLMLDQLEDSYNELEGANTQLEYMNDTLELQIEAETKLNREKDMILSQQSHMIALSELAQNLSHKWQKPLYQINKMIQELISSFKDGNLTVESANNKYADTQDLIKYLSQTLHDFKFFFNPDKEIQNFCVKDITEKAISLLKPNLDKAKIEVSLNIPEDHYIHGYPSEFTQAIINILNNSYDVIVERKVKKPSIDISLSMENDKSVLSIRDNAGGIPDEILGNLFEAYVSTKEEKDINGLGLYISKVIIEKKMEGSIEARNVEGGAEFRLII